MGNVAPIVMSALLFAGSAQFAATAVLAARRRASPRRSPPGILLNLRYVPMGIALAPSLRGGPLRRAAIGQAMIDFSWAAASRGRRPLRPRVHARRHRARLPVLGRSGTAIGVFAGDLIGDPGALGLDAIFPAFFLCLLVEGELRPGLPTVVAALGSLIALVLIPFTPAGRAGDRRLGDRAARAARRPGAAGGAA